MGGLSEEISDALATETVFTIPIFGGIGVDEGVVVTWIIMAVMILLAYILTRNLKVTGVSRRQAAVELLVTKLEGLFVSLMGEEAREHTTYLVTIMLYLAFANISGIFGFKPPTRELNVTIALAVMSIIYVQIAGIRKLRLKGWLKSFKKPMALVTPFNILDLVTRPLSLCMRLFGNILGSLIIMKLLEAVIPVFIPAAAAIYFDLFDGLLQAYVFVFLTAIYIKEATEIEEPEH